MLDAPTYPRAFIDHGNFKLELSDFKLKNNMLEGFVVIKKTNNMKRILVVASS